MTYRLRFWLSLACIGFAMGCNDLDEFRIQGDGVFEGAVVGSDSPAVDVGERCRFVLCGFPARTRLTLSELDPELLLSGQATGRITTSDGTFDNAQLLPVRGLAHDALSDYTFPGGGRRRNFIVASRFGTDQSRSAVVFVSFMENGRIELRLHAPATTAVSDDDLFGVFRLCRGGCDP